MITLTLDNITKIVATQAQADVLLKQGYSLVSGSAEATDVSLAATNSYVDSGSANPSYRGDGCLGELDGGLLHLFKTAMAGDNVTADMLPVIRYAYNATKNAGGDTPIDYFTEMEAVTELPDVAEANPNTLYLLTKTDGEFSVDLYAPDYDTFTPVSEFDYRRAPRAVLAQLSAAYDDLAQIVVDDISSQATIESEILAAIQAEIDVIDDNFTASFVTSTWTAGTRTLWSGIKLTGKNNANYTYTDYRNWTVGQDAEGVHGEISAAYNTSADIIVDDYSSKAAVEAYILPLIQAEIDAYDDNFTASFVSSIYDIPTRVWTGKVKVADNDIASNTYQDSAARTWTIGIPAEGIHEQFSVLYDDFAQFVVDDISSQATVDSEILAAIQAVIDAIDDNFTATFVSSTWTAGTRTWEGKICLTDERIPANTFTDASARSWTVGQDAEGVHGEISAAYNTSADIIVDDYSSKAAVEAYILPLIQAEIDAYDDNFTASFVSSIYDIPTRVWTGKVKVADNDITANTYQDSAARTWTIGIPAEGIHEQISAAYDTGATIEVTDYSFGAAVEAFILPLIQAEIDAIDNNFTASFDSSFYDDQAHTWTGKIKVQDKGITGNSFTDATARTWTITQTS